MMKKERVFITGMGVMSSIGVNFETFADAIRQGRSGAEAVHRPGESSTGSNGLSYHRVNEFDPLAHFDRRTLRRMDRTVQLAAVAARQAIRSARLDVRSIEPSRAGTILGTAAGGASNFTKYARRARVTGHQYVSFLHDFPYYSPGARIVGECGWTGPNIAFSTSCASANIALGYAAELVRHGRLDVALAGGSESHNDASMMIFNAVRLLTKDVMRPFDKNRSGSVLGEGAGVLCLESESHMVRRGARPLIEIVSCGFGADAYNKTMSDPTGKGLTLAISRALIRGGLTPADVDYINAHGNATDADIGEVRAIKKTLGSEALRVPVSSTKPMHGYVTGASGALEVIATMAGMQGGFIPPTINFVMPDPRCEIDCVPNTARPQRITVALSINTGLGGAASALALRSCF
jgi:3-oxoacyl-(acyl-carrier-protein) synthase